MQGKPVPEEKNQLSVMISCSVCCPSIFTLDFTTRHHTSVTLKCFFCICFSYRYILLNLTNHTHPRNRITIQRSVSDWLSIKSQTFLQHFCLAKSILKMKLQSCISAYEWEYLTPAIPQISSSTHPFL